MRMAAAAGIGNPAGAVVTMDAGNPRIISGQVRNEIISGGVFVFGSTATGVVSSGPNSFANSDLLFTRDASGAQFNGICLQTTTASGNVAVATEGFFLLNVNGAFVGGVPLDCDGNNAVGALGSLAGNLGATRKMGRSVTDGASGGYALVQITP